MSSSTWAKALDRLAPAPHPYARNPAGWVVDRCREFLWSLQVAILESVRDHRRTAVHSCHGSGKSFDVGRLAGWWIDVHPVGTAMVVTSAPTEDQVKGILWQEIGNAHERAELPGNVNQKEWRIGRHLVGIGRKPADYTEGSADQPPQTFQGYHRRYVLVILDEAGGIPEWLWEAANKLLTNDECRIIAIGNPDFEGSKFSKVCSAGSGWNVIHIDGLATPNFTGEYVPPDVAANLLGQAFIDEIVKDFGEDSPQYVAQVRGLFPADQQTGVVPWSGVQACRGAEILERIGGLRVPIELGVDVGAGGDRTVIRARRGMQAAEVWRSSSDDPEVVARAIDDAQFATGATSVKIDAIGIGWATVGHVRDKLATRGVFDCAVHAVNVAEASTAVDARGRPRFARRRDEIWWEVGRELTRHRRWDLSQCDERTVADLVAPRWAEDRHGRIQVESKDDVRRRLRRSPDDADALLLAFYDPPPAAPSAQGGRWRDSRLTGRR